MSNSSCHYLHIIFLKFSMASFTLSSSVWLCRCCGEEKRQNKKYYLPEFEMSHICRKPSESISFSHLLCILLLHLHRHLLLVVALSHLFSQLLHLFLQVAFLCRQLSHFLLHIDEALGGR